MASVPKALLYDTGSSHLSSLLDLPSALSLMPVINLIYGPWADWAEGKMWAGGGVQS